MRRHLINAIYGGLDYIAHPLGMLLVAPVILRKLGAAEYGVWMITTALISAGGILASGFCDASIRRIAQHRAAGCTDRITITVRNMFTINLTLGLIFATAAWIASPFAARHIAVSHTTPVRECLISLRIASVMILVRGSESVMISTQRAFEQYRSTVQIGAVVRWLTLASAALLAIAGGRMISILAATAFFLSLGACLQFRGLRELLGSVSLSPTFNAEEVRLLVGTGFFVWLQTLGGVIFSQLDRILLGVYLGAAAVAPYALCVQVSQPLFGLTASALSFLFPFLSGRAITSSNREIKVTISKAVASNGLLVALGAGVLLLFGERLLQRWVGSSVSISVHRILPEIVVGTALMGLSVTGTYSMQALGKFRVVAVMSLAGRAATLLLMVYLLRHAGLQGLAVTRICYGCIALLIYIPLLRRLEEPRPIAPITIPQQLQEGLKS